MKKNIPFLLAAAGVAMAQPVAAQDTAADAGANPMAMVDEAQAQALVRYALPYVFDSVRGKCMATLSSDGYFATNGDALDAKLRDGSLEAFKTARPIIEGFASSGMGMPGGGGDSEANPAAAGMDMGAMFAMMPDEALAPFAGVFMAEMAAGEVDSKSCADIEKAMALLDPLPADNLAGLAGMMFAMFMAEDDADTDEVEEMMDDGEM